MTRNWVPSDKPLGTLLTDKGVKRVSAGTKEHVRTSCEAINDVFRYIEECFANTSPIGKL